ncbi:MAG: efflux RND transporter periplasmic adaptor subunit, partial [bacterium]
VPVVRGDLAETIAATGTVEPEEVVDVGAQVAGQVISFGKDVDGKPVDYGSVVEAGTILARLDDEVCQADLAQAAAQRRQGEAQVVSAEANVAVLLAKLAQARADWERAQKLGPSDALAATTYDGYKAAFDVAVANVDAGKSAIQQATAQIAVADASVARAKRNLGYCVIKSPVRGVVIDRRVNIGQTVNGSMNAASLFLIAKDLRRMQVWVAVNEADIGVIKPGIPVTFQVDAFPDASFQGVVGKVRLNATMTQNVVTYTIEVVTDNSSGKLLPYLTANVKFEVARRNQVLTVPNAALRFTPSSGEKTTTTATRAKGAGKKKGAGAAADGTSSGRKHGSLWVRDGTAVRAIRVRTGLSDGSMTEVEGETVTEGLEVVVTETAAAAAGGTGAGNTPTATAATGDGTVNPFTPKMPSRRRNSGPPPPP